MENSKITSKSNKNKDGKRKKKTPDWFEVVPVEKWDIEKCLTFFDLSDTVHRKLTRYKSTGDARDDVMSVLRHHINKLQSSFDTVNNHVSRLISIIKRDQEYMISISSEELHKIEKDIVIKKQEVGNSVKHITTKITIDRELTIDPILKKSNNMTPENKQELAKSNVNIDSMSDHNPNKEGEKDTIVKPEEESNKTTSKPIKYNVYMMCMVILDLIRFLKKGADGFSDMPIIVLNNPLTVNREIGKIYDYIGEKQYNPESLSFETKLPPMYLSTNTNERNFDCVSHASDLMREVSSSNSNG